MRRAAQVIRQHHQMPRLPQKKTQDQSSSSMKRYLPCAEQRESSSNVAKFCACHEKKNHDQSSSSMKCYLQCAEQHKSSSNVTKCCACHEKKLS